MNNQETFGIDLQNGYDGLSLLGVGGSGEVFKARNKTNGQICALKVIPQASIGTRSSRNRFFRDTELFAAMKHPNIVQILDWGETTEGSFFVEMEYLQGRTLRTLLGSSPQMEPHRIHSIIMEVLKGLAFAHSQGIIHRDIKPENIMILEPETNGLEVRILDFGLATIRQFEGMEVTVTNSNLVQGTPGYLSPEEVLGREVSWSSDLYAVGVMWYELLSGNNPFIADSHLETAARQVDFHPPSISSLPGIARYNHIVENAVMGLLRKKPMARCSSTEKLISDLQIAMNPTKPNSNTVAPGIGKSTKEISTLLPKVSRESEKATKEMSVLRPLPKLETEKATKEIKPLPIDNSIIKEDS
jgi:eukaryotic-like serine/threonine-protein kinase